MKKKNDTGKEIKLQEIYKNYKERFIEINGKNRTLFTKNIAKKYSFDLGTILSHFDNSLFYDFLWRKESEFLLINEKIAKKLAKATEEDEVEILEKNLNDLKYLSREIDELQKETGKYDLCIGLGYIYGKIDRDISVRAPLLLFPISIEITKNQVVLHHMPDQPISLNKSLILAYCKENHINTQKIIEEFDPNEENSFKDIYDAIDHLNTFGFDIKYQKRKGVIPFDNTIESTTIDLEFKNMAVLGRFPMANPIYNDYITLEKENLTTPSIDLLLQGKQVKEQKGKKPELSYTVNDLDFAQEKAIKGINENNNMVIFGPPGTGKSQTIVNIISDALCKGKRILVVSQKQAALDVVFSRLGVLNRKAMLLRDPEREKSAFFDRVSLMHQNPLKISECTTQKYNDIQSEIDKELDILQVISDTIFSKSEFGLSLQEMYAKSYNISGNNTDYSLYTEFSNSTIASSSYESLSENMKYINERDIAKLYLERVNLIKKNPMIVHVKTDIDMHRLKEAHNFISKAIRTKRLPFDFSAYPHSRYLSTFYLERIAFDRLSVDKIAKIVTKVENPSLDAWRKSTMAIPPLWLLFPVVQYNYAKIQKNINIDLNIALHAFKQYEQEFEILQSVLTDEGFTLVIGGIINGNYQLLVKISEALENYLLIRNLNKTIFELDKEILNILDFSYNESKRTSRSFNHILEMLVPMRIYKEIVTNDGYVEEKLSKTVAFDNIRKRILELKTEQREIAKKLAIDKFSEDYSEYLALNPKESKDYLYQVEKRKNFWPIRHMVEYFEEYLMRLFPCWLLSPQAVSTIFPLKKEMFDLIVFDEASQMFIENALPAIYRGKKIVVAGDNKQLPPSSTFTRRYLADDFDINMDLSKQAALEVTSLLDLAMNKYPSVELAYHYRSNSSELIDFSNLAFYDNKLQIAPNLTLTEEHAIERIKVKGIWQNRHNQEEATAIVKLIKFIFKDRQNNESIGIVTFNTEQKEFIEDTIDAECDKLSSFRRQIYEENNRFEGGENHSLFVKNLENVQGDERDIIIFSVGYAKNPNNKVVAQFGSLSIEGGENRLNVAITRAKKKIYIVTSIEPEELDNVENYKNSGPKLLKKYLQYARAVSTGEQKEITKILSNFSPVLKTQQKFDYEEEIKNELEKIGYTVYTNLGNTYYKLSLGIFDKQLKKFILGIECDYQAYQNSPEVLERDVYRIKFLEGKGWKIVRVWSRDWWQSPKCVLEKLIAEAEKNKKILANSKETLRLGN
jgi:DNA polymerase III delta prime subunit